MLRIIQIGTFPISGQLVAGGVEASVYGLANELSKKHDVFIIDVPRKELEDSIETNERITVYRYKNKGSHNKDAVNRVLDMVQQIVNLNPSVCHIHGTGIISWELFDALKIKGIPLILTIHGLVKEEKRNSLKNRFSIKTLYQLLTQTVAERKLLHSATNVIVDTQYVADQIGGYHLKSCPPMTIIPQGIDNVFFQTACSSNSKNILSVGAFTQRKGHLLLIKSFEQVAQQVPDARLMVCGVVANQVYFDEVRNYVNASPFKDRISVLHNLPKDKLLLLYEQAHVFALHSQEESQGIVFAEAMATGLPVVATNVGGIPYVVEDDVTGLLSSYGDIMSFSSSLERLLTDDLMWEKMSMAGKDVSHRYAWSSIAQLVEAEYHTLV